MMEPITAELIESYGCQFNAADKSYSVRANVEPKLRFTLTQIGKVWAVSREGNSFLGIGPVSLLDIETADQFRGLMAFIGVKEQVQ